MRRFVLAPLLALLAVVALAQVTPTGRFSRTFPPSDGEQLGVGSSGPLPDELLLPFGNHPTLSNGLDAYWTMQDGAAGPGERGGLTFTKVGTVTAAAAKVGNGASITYSSYLSLAHSATVNVGETGNGATIALWANSSGSDDSAPFLAWDDGGFFTPAIGLFYNAGNVRLLGSDDTGSFKSIGSAFPYVTWKHIVGTYTPGDKLFRLYVDSVNTATSTATTSSTLENMSSYPLRLGSYLSGGINMGVIVDEVGMWDRALTLAEIQYLYNSGSGRAY